MKDKPQHEDVVCVWIPQLKEARKKLRRLQGTVLRIAECVKSEDY
jgi:hypothetical protein